MRRTAIVVLLALSMVACGQDPKEEAYERLSTDCRPSNLTRTLAFGRSLARQRCDIHHGHLPRAQQQPIVWGQDGAKIHWINGSLRAG